MYSILISAAVGLVIGLGGLLASIWGWVAAILLTLVATLATWIVVSRRMMKRVQPQLERVRKLAESGQIDLARQSLSDLLPMTRWVPLLAGQIHAQLGVLALHGGNRDKAIEHFKKASRRVAEGQLLLAASYYRNEQYEEALEVLASAAPFNRKHALFYNTYAYMLDKRGRRADAMAQLDRFLKKVPESGISKENLLRLQNDQRLDLKAFGNEWYALGIERPPAHMGELRTARKGFRQPPKAGRASKPEKKKKKKRAR